MLKNISYIGGNCTYTKMPPKVKDYLIKTIGKKETKRLLFFMKMRNYIILTGPTCSAKTTIKEILHSIGYPYVIDDNGLGRVIHTTEISGDLKSYSDIFEELEIVPKY